MICKQEAFGLAGTGPRGNDHIPACGELADRLLLVHVERPAGGQCLTEERAEGLAQHPLADKRAQRGPP